MNKQTIAFLSFILGAIIASSLTLYVYRDYSQDRSLVYANERFGFSFKYDEGYEGLWTADQPVIVIEEEDHGYVRFYIKGFHQFTIFVKNKQWWDANAEVRENGYARLKGGGGGIADALGIYLGENEKFAYTLYPNNQTCPDLDDTGGGPLCKLVRNDEEMVVKSFNISLDPYYADLTTWSDRQDRI